MSHLRPAELSDSGVAEDPGALEGPAPLVEEIAIPVDAIDSAVLELIQSAGGQVGG